MAKVWWNEYEEMYLQAMQYWKMFQNGKTMKQKEIIRFFKDYEKTAVTKLIFESNTIEKEGLSEADTKRIVFEGFESLDNDIVSVAETATNMFMGSLDPCLKIKVNAEKIKSGLSGLSVIFQSKQKEYLQVSNQLIAMLIVRGHAISFDLKTHLRKMSESKFREFLNCVTEDDDRKLYVKLRSESSYALLTQELLKEIHKKLAEEQDNNDNGLPGEYRAQGAFINFSTVFIEPSLVEKAVKKFIDEHNWRINHSDMFNPILEACKISADIVRIHPFGDFNGRSSRIILNMVLLAHELPFYLVLRGDGSHRKKYITAMKQYFKNGNLKGYIAFVCKTFVEQIREINKQLRMANVNQLVPEILSEQDRELLLKELEYYLEISRDI